MVKYYRIKYTDWMTNLVTEYLRVEDDKLDVLRANKPMKHCIVNEALGHTEAITTVELHPVILPMGIFGVDTKFIGVVCAHKESGLATIINYGEKAITLELVSIYYLIEVLDNKPLVYSLVRLISDTDYHRECLDLLLWQENQRFMGADDYSNVRIGAPLVKDGVLLWVIKSQTINGGMLVIDLVGVKSFAQGSLYFVDDSKNNAKKDNLLFILHEDLEAITLPIVSSFDTLSVCLMPQGVGLGALKSILSNVGYINKSRIFTKLVLTPGFYDCIGGVFIELPFAQQLLNVWMNQVFILGENGAYEVASKLVDLHSNKCSYRINFESYDMVLRKPSGEQLKFSMQVSDLTDWLKHCELPNNCSIPDYTVLKSFGNVTLLDIAHQQEAEQSDRASKALNELITLLYWLHTNDIQLTIGSEEEDGIIN